MNTIILANIVCFLAFLTELTYSFYKKDGVYTIPHTMGNLAHGVIYKIVSERFFIFYFGYIYLWYYSKNNTAPEITIASFIACFILVDFTSYLLHRMNHTINFFWIFHSVHHGDHKLNLSTTGRISWLEQSYVIIMLIPALLVGFSPQIVLLCAFWISVHQFFCHSHYLKLPKILDLIFITPNNHRIHHDSSIKNHNSNYGNVFSIWDRMFGTYLPELKTVNFGLENYEQNNFIKMEIDPIVRFMKSFNKK